MFETDSEFEDEVRRIARLLWPAAEFGGADIIDGRERDGIFETDEFVNCIECTVSRAKDKAVQDCTKLDKLLKKLSAKHPTKFLRGYFITLAEPTADQRSVANEYKGRIVACSYDQFRSRLVDARTYLSLREKYPFGSVRDPVSGAAVLTLDYVHIDIADDEGRSIDVSMMLQALAESERLVLTGDYGAGKSATAQQVFLRMARRFWEGRSTTFPLLLNLRDHHGQVDPVEAIERHARNLGFSAPSALVRAWRAGYCDLILDGFDEIASAGWVGGTKRLRELRYRSMELVRRCLRETPIARGVLITGRAHFFDSDRELGEALGISNKLRRLRLQDFSVLQLASFLARLGWNDAIPEWLPTRPLLLAYLASRQLLDKDLLGSALSPAQGWDHLLQRIAEREAEIEAGIDPTTVRVLLERVASLARATLDGIGPLSPDQLQEAFRSVCGYAPDDRGAVLLQRLPGLGAVSAEDGSRSFIDADFADAARAGDVIRFAEDPHNFALDASDWDTAIGQLGVEVAAVKATEAKLKAGRLSAALAVASGRGAQALGADLLLVMAYLGQRYDEGRVFLKELVIPSLDLDDGISFRNVEIQDSVVAVLEVASGLAVDDMPMMRRCHLGRVVGRTGPADLPQSRFENCTFGEFDLAGQTTHNLLALPLPNTCRVVLTLLKKLFAQAGTGRRETALYRGLDPKAHALVPPCLELLRRKGFAVRTRQGTQTIWMPVKYPEIRKRALAMLGAPVASSDELLVEARRMS